MARERSPFKVILNALPVAMTLEEVLAMRLIGGLLVWRNDCQGTTEQPVAFEGLDRVRLSQDYLDKLSSY
jgi:hypothetical protein